MNLQDRFYGSQINGVGKKFISAVSDENLLEAKEAVETGLFGKAGEVLSEEASLQTIADRIISEGAAARLEESSKKSETKKSSKEEGWGEDEEEEEHDDEEMEESKDEEKTEDLDENTDMMKMFMNMLMMMAAANQRQGGAGGQGGPGGQNIYKPEHLAALLAQGKGARTPGGYAGPVGGNSMGMGGRR